MNPKQCEFCGERMPARWKFTVCKPCEQALKAVDTKVRDWARAFFISYLQQVRSSDPERDLRPVRDVVQQAVGIVETISKRGQVTLRTNG